MDVEYFDAIYVSIGNSDNELTQREWSSFCDEVLQVVKDYRPYDIYGVWFSLPDARHQNACVAFSRATKLRQQTYGIAYATLKSSLDKLAVKYRQTSIAVVAGKAEFVGPGMFGNARRNETQKGS